MFLHAHGGAIAARSAARVSSLFYRRLSRRISSCVQLQPRHGLALRGGVVPGSSLVMISAPGHARWMGGGPKSAHKKNKNNKNKPPKKNNAVVQANKKKDVKFHFVYSEFEDEDDDSQMIKASSWNGLLKAVSEETGLSTDDLNGRGKASSDPQNALQMFDKRSDTWEPITCSFEELTADAAGDHVKLRVPSMFDSFDNDYDEGDGYGFDGNLSGDDPRMTSLDSIVSKLAHQMRSRESWSFAAGSIIDSQGRTISREQLRDFVIKLACSSDDDDDDVFELRSCLVNRVGAIDHIVTSLSEFPFVWSSSEAEEDKEAEAEAAQNNPTIIDEH